MKKPKRFDKRFLPMLWIGLAFWVGSIAIMYILEWAGVEMAGQDNLFDLGKTMFQRLPIFTLLLFCLLQPILEEILRALLRGRKRIAPLRDRVIHRAGAEQRRAEE